MSDLVSVPDSLADSLAPSPLSPPWSSLFARRARGRLSAITQLIRSHATVAAAIETLVARGLVPDHWLDARLNERAFAPESLCGHCQRGWTLARYRVARGSPPLVRCTRCNNAIDSCGALAMPASLDELIAMALDPSAIETAESLARELFARLPDAPSLTPRVLWRFVEKDRESELLCERSRFSTAHIAADELGCLALDVQYAIEAAQIARGAARSLPSARWIDGAPSRARGDLLAAGAWRAAQSIARGAFDEPLDARCPASAAIEATAALLREDARAALYRRAAGLDELARLPSPFEPAMALWNMGVGIQAATTRTVVLVLPVGG